MPQATDHPDAGHNHLIWLHIYPLKPDSPSPEKAFQKNHGNVERVRKGPVMGRVLVSYVVDGPYGCTDNLHALEARLDDDLRFRVVAGRAKRYELKDPSAVETKPALRVLQGLARSP